MILRVCAILLVLIFAGPMPSRLEAQTWSVDGFAGQVDYKSLPSLLSSSAALAVRYNRDRREFQAAIGVPLTSTDITWGVAGAGDRFAIRRGGVLVGVDASGYVHLQRDPILDSVGKGALAEGLPMVSYTTGSSLLEFRSGPRWYKGWLGGAAWTRTLWTTEFRAATLATERLRFEGDARHDRNRQGEAYTRLGFRAGATLKRFDLQGSVGHWVDGIADAKPEWGLSVDVPIGQRLSVFSSALHESFNPQFLGPPRTSWAVGLTLRIGRSEASSEPAGFEVVSGSRFVLRIPLDESPAAASIAGDFNGWMPEPMQRQGDEWVFPLNLSPGVYRFAFRTAAGEWFVPKSIPSRAEDGMGGWVATVVVQ